MENIREKFNMIKNDKAKLVGFLYAFESQQPDVSKSKLEGLNKWFNISEKLRFAE